MKKTIYIEKKIKNLARVKTIINRFRDPIIIYIDRYTEVFNKKNQNFAMQKINPAIILAKKQGNFLLKTPESYTIGRKNNYYFSYMYNCIFDCRYCFLQGLYHSSNFVIFVNYEDFLKEMEVLEADKFAKDTTIFSGYDCDSMAYDNITNFAETALISFNKFKKIELEIRTKSTYLKPFMKKRLKNIVLAFSFTPERFSSKYEFGVANTKKRISALKAIIDYGWKIGIRLDPFVVYEGWENDYKRLFESLFKVIPSDQMHSVTYGNIRFPKNIFMNIKKNYSDEDLFFKFIKQKQNIYDEDNGELIKNFCKHYLFNYVDKSKVYCNIHEK